jgi:membrane protein required for colicin V production
MFNTLDWICFGLLALSMIMGVWRGLILELMSLGGWFVASVAAYYGAPWLSPFLAATGQAESIRHGIAFAIIFIVVLIAWRLIANALKQGVGAIGLGLLDRGFGAVFGILRGALFMTVFAVLIHHTPVSSTEFWQTSAFVKVLMQAALIIQPFVPASAAGLIPSSP